VAYGTQDFYVVSATVFPVLLLAGIVENQLSYTSGYKPAEPDPPTRLPRFPGLALLAAIAVGLSEWGRSLQVLWGVVLVSTLFSAAALGEAGSLRALYEGHASAVDAWVTIGAWLVMGAILAGTLADRGAARVRSKYKGKGWAVIAGGLALATITLVVSLVIAAGVLLVKLIGHLIG
jgi:hypothetical protein